VQVARAFALEWNRIQKESLAKPNNAEIYGYVLYYILLE